MIDTRPRTFRHYLALVATTTRTMLDVAMLVAGSGLVGLAVAVLLAGFGLVGDGIELGIGSLLGSALVLGVVGAFALGIAGEGRYGVSEGPGRFTATEILAGRAGAGLAVSVLLLVAAGRLEGLAEDLSLPLRAGHELLRVTAVSGLWVSVPAAAAVWLWARADRTGLAARLEIAAVYVVWAAAALLLFRMP